MQQASVHIELTNHVDDHGIHAWLTAICCCSLFMAHLGCHSSAGSNDLLRKSCRYSQKSEGAEATIHTSRVGNKKERKKRKEKKGGHD